MNVPFSAILLWLTIFCEPLHFLFYLILLIILLFVDKVFKPRNPWTMSVMNCLAELHQEPELKLTLKFEVEVLCKALNIDIQVN